MKINNDLVFFEWQLRYLLNYCNSQAFGSATKLQEIWTGNISVPICVSVPDVPDTSFSRASQYELYVM